MSCHLQYKQEDVAYYIIIPSSPVSLRTSKFYLTISRTTYRKFESHIDFLPPHTRHNSCLEFLNKKHNITYQQSNDFSYSGFNKKKRACIGQVMSCEVQLKH